MKKLHSMLAILLILTCLLSVLASCNNAEPVEEEETTAVEDSSSGNKSYPMTEKDKENLYKNAMAFLVSGDAESAFLTFSKIPDYKNVSEYLDRFVWQSSTVYEYSPDKVDHVNKYGHTFNSYGLPTKTTQRGEKSVDINYVYDDTGRFLVMKTHSPYVYRYTYDELTGLLATMETQYGTELTNTTYHYGDKANPSRVTSTEAVTVSSTQANKLLRTVLTEYTYNAQGDPIKEVKTTTTPNSDPALLPTVVVDETIYTYENGLLVKFESVDILGKYTIVYEYENELLMKETLTHEAEAPEITDENYGIYTDFVYEETITYTYDEKGRVTDKIVVSKILEEPPKGNITPDTPKLILTDKTRTWQYTKYDIYYNPFA